MNNTLQKTSAQPIGKAKYVVSKVVFGVMGVIMAVFALSLIVPIVWTLLSSFKDTYDFTLRPFSLPDIWYAENYTTAWNALTVEVWNAQVKQLVVYTYGRMFVYSLLITTVTSFMNVFLPAITAYIVCKYKFPGRNTLYRVAIFTMIIPIVGGLSSSLAIRRALGIYDNLIPYLLTSGSGFGFNFILLYGAFKGLSWSYAEAAFIDGASHHRVMYRIFMPMMLPTMFALFILAFVGGWNDYMTVIVYLPSYPNLAYGIYMFNMLSTVKQHSDPEVMAGFVLVAIPTVIIWCASQKFIAGKVMVGGLKG